MKLLTKIYDTVFRKGWKESLAGLGLIVWAVYDYKYNGGTIQSNMILLLPGLALLGIDLSKFKK